MNWAYIATCFLCLLAGIAIGINIERARHERR